MGTREILATMRKFTDGHAGYWHAHGVSAGLRLSRAYGRRRYIVELHDSMRSAGPIMIDVTEREFYIRPAARGNNRPEDPIYDRLRQDAAETRLFDVLMEQLAADGYTPMPWSETPETLAAWRDARTTADHYA